MKRTTFFSLNPFSIMDKKFICSASYGSNFCKSAKEAFSLILRNCARVAVLDKVGITFQKPHIKFKFYVHAFLHCVHCVPCSKGWFLQVTDFLLFMGKLVVVGSVALLSYFVFSGDLNMFKQRREEKQS